MAKSSAPVSGAETTGDFLLEFGHLQVAFGRVVVAGNAQVGEEAQDLVAVLAQPPNEVAGRGLFDPPAGAGTAGTGRIAGFGFGFGFGEDGVVAAGPQALDVAGGQCLEGLGLGFADQGIGLAQQRDHIGCPRLAWGPLSDSG